MYDKFYKKTSQERRDILDADGRYNLELDTPLGQEIAEQMVENAVSTYELPLGVATNFLINQKDYVVAMATEEPSVIAAASNAAKIMRTNGGIQAHVKSRIMTGQIAFPNPKHSTEMQSYIDEHTDALANICHNAYPSIVKRGGGVRSISHRFVDGGDKTSFFIVYLSIDTQEAMGANMMNTMLETLSSYLQSKFDETPLMSILSNLATECIVSATVTIDPKTLKHSEDIGLRLKQASDLAQLDPYRAATHNKGTMNGIDAVVIATGNDWRAIEAAAHAYASRSGSYQPLATWDVNESGFIVGSIELPMPIGTVGGSIGIHPKAKLSKEVMRYESAIELMEVIASVGLSQNFAALYALTTVGIQKGHMQLQARSLALNAGAPLDKLDLIVAELTQRKPMNLETAQSIVSEYTKI
ncbi:hydroxymethylglutaryl-CoA reductase, degradative [Erysipelothrix sp. HDW6C]|uniref:hydroxymethylglutaryl-CoA reductase, degradative n=1 Tax=Erysipelothrix sp. HDW6C TaxID=2714930 RepID=UPI001407D9CA|nr:hydroxymethylglutaryl-CoA reductase, degradative [Erysipelothrix sp. HDW6C]QIK69262.1 hydroxymethylglutaryl-CoA reductase, degradative [Erysipelothrix sp. HDW6C]